MFSKEPVFQLIFITIDFKLKNNENKVGYWNSKGLYTSKRFPLQIP